jgi:hypothetical protein
MGWNGIYEEFRCFGAIFMGLFSFGFILELLKP